MGSGDEAAARKALLAAAWDEAASGYDRYFSPRFAPWIEDALSEITSRAGELPRGPVLVPCCGPGRELELLAARLPGREILGSDLSRGMVELARARVASLPLVRVEQADASRLDERYGRENAALLSCFGLQQIPAAPHALESWGRSLARGGVLSVVFWPPDRRDEGPFGVLQTLVAARVPAPDASWEKDLVAALERAGVSVLRDSRVRHGMQHESADAFFVSCANGGPLHSLALSKGEAFMAELRAAFVAAMPAGRIEHEPEARSIVGRKQ